jgi:hypothetical protein
MLNILTNLTAIAATLGPLFITDTTGSRAIDIADAMCKDLQPIQIFGQGSTTAQLVGFGTTSLVN